MRTLVAAVATLAVLAATGCAASPVPPAAAAPAPLPHPILAEATPAPAPAGNEVSPSEEPKSEHADRQMRRAVGWIVLSVGIEGAILATVTSFMMLHENSVRNDDCADKVCSSDGVSANGKLANLAGWNAVAWGVAAVGVGAGAFILLTNPSDRALGTQVGVGATGSGSGMLLRGSF